jgi:hypothetical protein
MPKNKIIPTKGPWKKNEDDLLKKLVMEYGPKNWSFIATKMHDHDVFRLGKQCRERWYNHLSPEVRKDPWTEEEDRIIIEAHSELGSKWTTIANMLGNGRTPNSIKNRWNSTLKRVLTTGDIAKKRRTRSTNSVKRKFSELDENSSELDHVSLSPLTKKRRIFKDDDLEPSPRLNDYSLSPFDLNENNIVINQIDKNSDIFKRERENLIFTAQGDPIVGYQKEYVPEDFDIINENLCAQCDQSNYNDFLNEPNSNPQLEAWNHHMNHYLESNRYLYGYGDQILPNGYNIVWEENEYDPSPIDNINRRNHINDWREYYHDPTLHWL